jgi:Protein of unknown function (DUF2934)
MTEGPFFGSSDRRRRLSKLVAVFPTPDEIADRAYELFIDAGSRAEHEADYWRRAEDELLDRAARRVIR